MSQNRLTVATAREEGQNAARYFMQNEMPKGMDHLHFEKQGISFAMNRTRVLSNASAEIIRREIEEGWNSVWAERPAEIENAPLFITTVNPGDVVFLLDTHGFSETLKRVEISRKAAKTIYVNAWNNTFDVNGLENQPGTFNKRAQLFHITPELEDRYLRQTLLERMQEITFADLTTDQLFDIYRIVNPNLAAAVKH